MPVSVEDPDGQHDLVFVDCKSTSSPLALKYSTITSWHTSDSFSIAQGRIQELNEGGVHNEFLMRGGVQ